MRIAIATRRLAPPFFLGGVEVNHRILAKELIAVGHEVCHIGSYTHPRWQDERMLPDVLAGVRTDPSLSCAATSTSRRVSYSSPYGDVVMSGLESFEETLATTLEEHRSELVLTTCAGSADICLLAKSVGVPSVSWVQDVGEDGHQTFGASAVRRIYASRYLRQFFAPGDDDSTVFYPPFQPLPLLPPARSRTVLMVNAIPEKGSNVFLALARAYPDLKFVALTGWRRPEWVDSAPTNAVCLERALDPIPAYRSADVVLVPSPVPEGFGRVAVEAALLGRRILCHASGGLREAAGLSENLLPDTDPQTWISALSSVLAEGGARRDVLRRSRQHAKRFVRPVAAEFLRMAT